MTEERTLATYEVVRNFWRTTEAFDTVRGKMPPDGVFLKDGGAYFVSHSIAVRAPIPIQTIELFVRPDLKTRDDGWSQDEDLHARTERRHPYADLGPRPHHFKRLFPGTGTSFREIRSVFTPDVPGFTLRLNHDAIRDYIVRTAGPRGNGNSGYLAVSFGESVEMRFVFTPKQGQDHASKTSVSLNHPVPYIGQVGLPPYAVLYALRFIGEEAEIHVGRDRLWMIDKTNGNCVVLATRTVGIHA